MPLHREIALRAGVERSTVTRQLGGSRQLTPEVARAAEELRAEERAATFAELAEESLKAGDVPAAEAAVSAARRLIGGD